MFNIFKKQKNNTNNTNDKINKILEILIERTVSKNITWSKIKKTQGEYYLSYSKNSVSNNGFKIEIRYPGGSYINYFIYLDDQLIFKDSFECYDSNDIFIKLTQLWDFVDKIENFPDEEIEYKSTESKLDEALERLEV